MGAFGAALVAKEGTVEGTISTLSVEQLDSFSVETSMGRCKNCANQCVLTINEFNNQRKFISGNRCETMG